MNGEQITKAAATMIESGRANQTASGNMLVASGEFSRAAYVVSQAAAAIVEALGMAAENQRRLTMGESPAYGESDFFNLSTRCGLDHNSVVSMLKD
jgi:hypothetical protein